MATFASLKDLYLIETLASIRETSKQTKAARLGYQLMFSGLRDGLQYGQRLSEAKPELQELAVDFLKVHPAGRFILGGGGEHWFKVLDYAIARAENNPKTSRRKTLGEILKQALAARPRPPTRYKVGDTISLESLTFFSVNEKWTTNYFLAKRLAKLAQIMDGQAVEASLAHARKNEPNAALDAGIPHFGKSNFCSAPIRAIAKDSWTNFRQFTLAANVELSEELISSLIESVKQDKYNLLRILPLFDAVAAVGADRPGLRKMLGHQCRLFGKSNWDNQRYSSKFNEILNTPLLPGFPYRFTRVGRIPSLEFGFNLLTFENQQDAPQHQLGYDAAGNLSLSRHGVALVTSSSDPLNYPRRGEHGILSVEVLNKRQNDSFSLLHLGRISQLSNAAFGKIQFVSCSKLSNLERPKESRSLHEAKAMYLAKAVFDGKLGHHALRLLAEQQEKRNSNLTPTVRHVTEALARLHPKTTKLGSSVGIRQGLSNGREIAFIEDGDERIIDGVLGRLLSLPLDEVNRRDFGSSGGYVNGIGQCIAQERFSKGISSDLKEFKYVASFDIKKCFNEINPRHEHFTSGAFEAETRLALTKAGLEFPVINSMLRNWKYFWRRLLDGDYIFEKGNPGGLPLGLPHSGAVLRLILLPLCQKLEKQGLRWYNGGDDFLVFGNKKDPAVEAAMLNLTKKLGLEWHIWKPFADNGTQAPLWLETSRDLAIKFMGALWQGETFCSTSKNPENPEAFKLSNYTDKNPASTLGEILTLRESENNEIRKIIQSPASSNHTPGCSKEGSQKEKAEVPPKPNLPPPVDPPPPMFPLTLEEETRLQPKTLENNAYRCNLKASFQEKPLDLSQQAPPKFTIATKLEFLSHGIPSWYRHGFKRAGELFLSEEKESFLKDLKNWQGFDLKWAIPLRKTSKELLESLSQPLRLKPRTRHPGGAAAPEKPSRNAKQELEPVLTIKQLETQQAAARLYDQFFLGNLGTGNFKRILNNLKAIEILEKINLKHLTESLRELQPAPYFS